MYGLARGLGVAGAIAACLLMLTTSIDVASRAVRGASVPGLVDLSETLLVVLIFFGLAHAEARWSHVRVTLVTSRLPPQVTFACRLIAYVVMTVWLAMVAWSSMNRALSSFRTGEYRFGLLQWPLWPARWAIVVGLACFLGVVLVRLVTVHRHHLAPDREGQDLALTAESSLTRSGDGR